MLHVSAAYVFKGVESRDFWVGNLFDSASRAGVPLFVMISGALMLDENYVFAKEKWFRHILKLLCFFLFWSVAYAVLYPFIKHEEINLLNAVRSILKGHYHLWFIPMIIGLYLMIPLLRLWVNRQKAICGVFSASVLCVFIRYPSSHTAAGLLPFGIQLFI